MPETTVKGNPLSFMATSIIITRLPIGKANHHLFFSFFLSFFLLITFLLVTTLLMTILAFTWRENKNNVQEIKEKYNVTAFTTN